MRVAKAQSELGEYLDSSEFYDLTNVDNGPPQVDENDLQRKKEDEMRKKYDIPEGVHLFVGGMDAALTKDNAKTCKPHLAAFVKGKLTEHGMSDMIFYFEECAECDYGWILVERPMGFYDQPSGEDMDDVRREIESIGTRSRSKNTKLPKIAGVFSSK